MTTTRLEHEAVKRLSWVLIFVLAFVISANSQTTDGPSPEELQRRASSGDVQAQVSLGNAYWNGSGVPQDYAQAANLYRLAADQRSAAAQFNLGLAYEYGHGVPQDNIQAASWYRLAADQGLARARDQLAQLELPVLPVSDVSAEISSYLLGSACYRGARALMGHPGDVVFSLSPNGNMAYIMRNYIEGRLTSTYTRQSNLGRIDRIEQLRSRECTILRIQCTTDDRCNRSWTTTGDYADASSSTSDSSWSIYFADEVKAARAYTLLEQVRQQMPENSGAQNASTVFPFPQSVYESIRRERAGSTDAAITAFFDSVNALIEDAPRNQSAASQSTLLNPSQAPSDDVGVLQEENRRLRQQLGAQQQTEIRRQQALERQRVCGAWTCVQLEDGTVLLQTQDGSAWVYRHGKLAPRNIWPRAQ